LSYLFWDKLMIPNAARPKTKIICTLGPATSSEKAIQALVDNGMSIARLNLSHGTLDEHIESINLVRTISSKLDVPVGIMVDVPGIKYRVGRLGEDLVKLTQGKTVTLTSKDIIGSASRISISPAGIHLDGGIGRKVLLDDGLIELEVLSVSESEVECTITRGGTLTEGKGVATPGKSPSHKFPNDKAIRSLEFARAHSVDFVAISTVTSAKDVISAREILMKDGYSPYIISKIERADAILNFDEILVESDSIMVARGDMGVEVRLAEVPVIQKRLISKCNQAGKPVITATQMLESMVRSSVPTRAEVTDVANAIYDGTDAIMLSGETSIGKFPSEAVKVMAEVAIEAESDLPYRSMIVEKMEQLEPQADDAISYDACQTAYQLGANLIVAFTESGSTAFRVSKYRPVAPILALTTSKLVQQKLSLAWGVIPITVSTIETVDKFFEVGEEMAAKICGIPGGSLVVLVAGLPIGVPGGTNLLRVLTIK